MREHSPKDRLSPSLWKRKVQSNSDLRVRANFPSIVDRRVPLLSVPSPRYWEAAEHQELSWVGVTVSPTFPARTFLYPSTRISVSLAWTPDIGHGGLIPTKRRLHLTANPWLLRGDAPNGRFEHPEKHWVLCSRSVWWTQIRPSGLTTLKAGKNSELKFRKKKLNISQKYVDLSTTMTLRFSSQSVKLLRLIVWSLVSPT